MCQALQLQGALPVCHAPLVWSRLVDLHSLLVFWHASQNDMHQPAFTLTVLWHSLGQCDGSAGTVGQIYPAANPLVETREREALRECCEGHHTSPHAWSRLDASMLASSVS